MASEQKTTDVKQQLGRGVYVRLTTDQEHAVARMLSQLVKKNPDISVTRSDAIRHLITLGAKRT